MFVKLIDIYGLPNRVAYYRKNGDCFDFVTSRDLASELTEVEANNVMEHKEWYCNQFGARDMEVENGKTE